MTAPFEAFDRALGEFVAALREWRAAHALARGPFAWSDGEGLSARMNETTDQVRAAGQRLAERIHEAEAEALERFGERSLAALQVDVAAEVLLLTTPAVGSPS